MAAGTTLRMIASQVPASQGELASRLLRQVAHDLGTPVSTVGIELYSARLVLERACCDPAADVARLTRELEEMCVNVDRARSELAIYLGRLGRLADELAAGGPLLVGEPQR